MRLTLKRVTIFVFVVYFLLTCYTAYILLRKNPTKTRKQPKHIFSISEEEEWNPWGEEFEREQQHTLINDRSSVRWWNNHSLGFGKQYNKAKSNDSKIFEQQTYSVEIWGKAAIGLYLWEHVFNGKTEKKMDGIWSYGFRKIDNIKFKFRTGPGVVYTKVPSDVEYLILILNGRNDQKVSFAKSWLNYLPHFKNLHGVILVLLGDEKCRNDWILPYMSFNGGYINATLIVYDSPLIDNFYFFQWPLGVATYRNFPKEDSKQLDLESERPFVCNFLGTVYPESSRQYLLEILEKNNLSHLCIIKVRYEWQPHETRETLETYVHSLKLSDLTLSPVGMNSECYRIYEAMAYGSVPVVEDVITPGNCASSKTSAFKNILPPFRLLKSLNAPIIFVKNWSELPKILKQEKSLSQDEKSARRIKVVQWYENFKTHQREQLIYLMKQRFFNTKR